MSEALVLSPTDNQNSVIILDFMDRIQDPYPDLKGPDLLMGSDLLVYRNHLFIALIVCELEAFENDLKCSTAPLLNT